MAPTVTRFQCETLSLVPSWAAGSSTQRSLSASQTARQPSGTGGVAGWSRSVMDPSIN